MDIGSLKRAMLVGPVPDETALQLFVALDHIPVILKVADTISHSMSVLAHDERPVPAGIDVFLYLSDPSIHGRVDVCV